MSTLFPNAPVQVSLKDQIAEVGRECAMRRRVYPRWVADNKMTQAAADRQIAAMDAALSTLAKLARDAQSVVN